MKRSHTCILILYFCLISVFSNINTNDRDSVENENRTIMQDPEILDPENILMSDNELIRLSFEQEKDQLYLDEATEEELESLRVINPKKEYTLVVFMAADNDLHRFALKNITQMEAVGSNKNMNIIVQLNTPGYFNPTKRYVIKNGKRLCVEADGPTPTHKLNSGNPQTLIDCVDWAMKYYPADKLILNFWNHGSGCWDPGVSKTINTCDLFRVNTETNRLELDRSIEYIEHIEEQNNTEEKKNSGQQRGICFDETYKSYMSNQDVKYALQEIHHRILGGKKIAAVWFDACLMSMIEIANICKNHADYLIGSQDVEYASGSNYQLALNPFLNHALSPCEFACHVVKSFEKAYQQITPDYTQSAIDLSQIHAIESNINLVAEQIILALQNEHNKSVVKMLQQCKSRPLCTCFEEPSFIDLRHFYINLQAYLWQMRLTNTIKENQIKTTLSKLLGDGINLINSAVVANVTGSNLKNACGLSIYFPEKLMFNSYLKSNFGQSNNWSIMLSQYISQNK